MMKHSDSMLVSVDPVITKPQSNANNERLVMV
jgi:hypothetical protein